MSMAMPMSIFRNGKTHAVVLRSKIMKLFSFHSFCPHFLSKFGKQGRRGEGEGAKKKNKKIKRWVGELNNLGEDGEFFFWGAG